jgi:serine/threonine protein kinase
MAPEQAMAQDIGPWTDLYSVGCMAFEMFTGNVPFHDSDAPMAILLRHIDEPIAAVNSIRPEVDQRIPDWIALLLVKDPAQRTRGDGPAAPTEPSIATPAVAPPAPEPALAPPPGEAAAPEPVTRRPTCAHPRSARWRMGAPRRRRQESATWACRSFTRERAGCSTRCEAAR